MHHETTPQGPTEPITFESAWVRLGALAGVPRDALLAQLPQEGPERARFDAALRACGPLLQPLCAGLGGSLLGRFLRDARFEGEGEVSPKRYPKEARSALQKGEIVASSDADAWVFWTQKSGAVQVSHAHPESFVVLGESIAEWLSAEAAQLEAARSKKKAPKKGASAAAAEGKPAIDAALVRLVQLSGGPDPSAKLATLAHKRDVTRWGYFRAALAACGAAWSPALLGVTKGRLLGRCLSGTLHDGDEPAEVEDGDDDLDGINPVYVKRYPKAAQKLLREVKPGNFVASSGPEVWFLLWDAKGAKSSWNITLHHAAHDGYEALGTLEAWLAAEVSRVEAALG